MEYEALDLSALERSEWQLVIPWFRNVYNERDPNNKYYLYDYGWAGIHYSTKGKFNWLETINTQLRGQSLAPAVRRDLEQKRKQLENQIGQTVRGYMKYFRQSADMGYEPAQKSLTYLSALFGD